MNHDSKSMSTSAPASDSSTLRSQAPPVADGLEGVVVAETELACVDGAGGHLVIRGHEIETLAGNVPYEAVCQLLWQGRAEGEALPALQRALGQGRGLREAGRAR